MAHHLVKVVAIIAFFVLLAELVAILVTVFEVSVGK